MLHVPIHHDNDHVCPLLLVRGSGQRHGAKPDHNACTISVASTAHCVAQPGCVQVGNWRQAVVCDQVPYLLGCDHLVDDQHSISQSGSSFNGSTTNKSLKAQCTHCLTCWWYEPCITGSVQQ
jgi:hypothetical protein